MSADQPDAGKRRHPSGFVTYRGDCRHMAGEIKGPTTYGSYLIAVATEYDAEADRTRVAFAYCRQDDVDSAVRDEFGILRVPELAS